MKSNGKPQRPGRKKGQRDKIPRGPRVARVRVYVALTEGLANLVSSMVDPHPVANERDPDFKDTSAVIRTCLRDAYESGWFEPQKEDKHVEGD